MLVSYLYSRCFSALSSLHLFSPTPAGCRCIQHRYHCFLCKMPSRNRKYILNMVSLRIGCSSCRLSDFFTPRRGHGTPSGSHSRHPSSTSRATTTFSSSVHTPPLSYSSETESDIQSLRALRVSGMVDRQSLAVEKDSDDPYMDFRRSMLQMILEKELYARDDLRQLLNCFLQLNDPYYHGTIIRAFTDIFNGLHSSRSYVSQKLPVLWN